VERRGDTAVPLETLRRWASGSPRCRRASSCTRASRRSSRTARRWRGQAAARLGHGRELAYATLLAEGLSACACPGQDSGRGTFFHRHAVLHDQNRERWDEGTYIPLQHVTDNQGDFTVIDSVLSEEAVLGFEYGYATPSRTSW
jgi:2-oxoglutarate dehydrogenase E1 component